MYGLVNKAIQDLITQQHGKATWQRIATAAGDCSTNAMHWSLLYKVLNELTMHSMTMR